MLSKIYNAFFRRGMVQASSSVFATKLCAGHIGEVLRRSYLKRGKGVRTRSALFLARP
jgi:hypothetical protein